MAAATAASGSLVQQGQRTAEGDQRARADSSRKTRPMNGGTPWISAERRVVFDENNSPITASAVRLTRKAKADGSGPAAHRNHPKRIAASS